MLGLLVAAVGVDVDPNIVVVVDRHGVGLDQFAGREVASLVHRDIRTVGVAPVGQHEIETVGIVVPFEETVAGGADRAGIEGEPPRLGIITEVLKDDVAAASGDVAVEDRAAVIDLLGDPTDLAGVEVGVAELELDVFALVGEEQHAATQDDGDHHAGDADEDRRASIHLWTAGDGHGTSLLAPKGAERSSLPSISPYAIREATPVDLFEYQGKQFFAQYGMPVSPGQVAFTVDEAVAAAEELGTPVMVKAQVHTGGRGKAGGVKFAADIDAVREHATNILGLDINGHLVKRVWIEKASDIAEEYYASFTLDRSAKKHLGMLSKEGGVEIETVAEENPDAIAKIWVDPVVGLDEATTRAWVAAANLPEAAVEGAVDILQKLYTAYTDGDCDLVEINPLILTPEGKVHVLDAKVTLDGNSTFRHEDYTQFDETQPRDDREQAAHAKGLQYVGLDGSVGVIANGAGLAMSTVDVVNQVGGSPANFLDIGGGANADVMAGAMEVINNDPNVKSIFINIFGGITRGEEVANGILEAMQRVEIDSPIVIRLDGTNAEEGRAILAPNLSDKLMMEETMLDAARKAVELAS